VVLIFCSYDFANRVGIENYSGTTVTILIDEYENLVCS
jgi:hypothetical protein